MNKKSRVFIITILLLFTMIVCCFAKEESICVKEEDVGGSGKYPYNFRIIDDKLFAGGNLFNPVSHENSPEKVREYVKLLKDMGVTSIVALHVPSGSEEILILNEIAEEEGLIFYACPMNAEKVPTEEETEYIMELIENKSYIHCNWGADRTGAIIAKYLRLKKNYNGYEAWSSVISGGSHAGIIGGLKESYGYGNLVIYFWPEVFEEDEGICNLYGI